MGLNNKKLNLIIGIDTVNANVKIMRIFGKDTGSAKVEYVPAPVDALNRGEWDKVIDVNFSCFINTIHTPEQLNLQFVIKSLRKEYHIITNLHI